MEAMYYSYTVESIREKGLLERNQFTFDLRLKSATDRQRQALT